MKGPAQTPKSGHCATRLLRTAVAVCVMATCAVQAVQARQARYASPQEAVDALVAAVRSGKVSEIVSVLGNEGREVASSGDPVADASARQRFLGAFDSQHRLQLTNTRAVLVVGPEDFPFPIPIVHDGSSWRFDTAAGRDEILDRRIGGNEHATIEAMRAYVDAQNEYAQADRDGKGPQFARRMLSSDGKKDGLYWPAVDGEEDSPLGPLIAAANREGYRKRSDAPVPFHGYVYRILLGQGTNARGGARDYVAGGRMIGGFGLVASPAEYGSSGVMTFLTNQDGVVFQKDLGPNTGQKAATIKSFDPDTSWSKVSE